MEKTVAAHYKLVNSKYIDFNELHHKQKEIIVQKENRNSDFYNCIFMKYHLISSK